MFDIVRLDTAHVCCTGEPNPISGTECYRVGLAILRAYWEANLLMMSAETGRKAPYSSDLRWRVVWQRTAMELKLREISRNLGLSLGTVHDVWKRFVLTGDVESRKPPARYESRTLTQQHEQIVVGLVMEDPAMYLKEMCDKILEITRIPVSASTVCRILHRHGLTRKKIKQTSIQRCALYRGDFMAEIHLYGTSQLVWIDESGCDNKDHIRKYGYALKGLYPEVHRILHRGQRVSAIAAMKYWQWNSKLVQLAVMISTTLFEAH